MSAALKSNISTLIDLGLKIALLLIIIPVFVPFAPKMPAPGLDASWALALNQAVAQGLSFGKQIIFTLGPYSSIYTKAYHPATDLMMIGGSLYLALSYWMGLVLLTQNSKWRWLLAFAVLLLGMIYARDSLFFSYPLIIGCIACKELPKKSWIVFLLVAPLGLLALIKGSLLILSLVMTLLCTAYCASHKQKKLALICLLTPIGSMMFFWLLAGQSVFNLPSYISSSIALASDFTQAMALDGDEKEIILYLIASGLVLLTIAVQKKLTGITKFFLFCSVAIFLFLSFKAGFTRHYGHSFISGTSILIAAFLLPFLFNSRAIIPVLLFSIYTANYIDGQHTQISLLNNFIATYSSAWHGFKNRLHDANWAKQNYTFTMEFLRKRAAFPVLQGSTDIYSYDQTLLIASTTNWSPRPVFQSYSVFNAAMAVKNKNHLIAANRPDTIIFKVEPIDERLPSIEDGASWPALLNHYVPVQLINDFLILKKNPHPKNTLVQRSMHHEVHSLGEIVYLPQRKQPVFVQLELKPTLWGLAATTLFKPAYLFITVELNNGSKKEYRLIANMAQSGFLLSPLIESTTEFGLLYGRPDLLNSKKVKSFVISGNHQQWQSQYLLRITTS